VLGLLDLSSFLDSFGPEGREDTVQVLHAVVDHEGGAILTEVLRLRGEDGPDRGPSGLPVLPTPPREEGHRILDVHPQMTTVPLDQCLRILRFEEDASDARYAGSARSCDDGPGGVLDGYEGEAERSLVGSGRPGCSRIRPRRCEA